MKTWKDNVQKVYSSPEGLEAYDRIYGIARRCGFGSAKELWEANPVIGGSVNPADFGVVRKTKTKHRGLPESVWLVVDWGISDVIIGGVLGVSVDEVARQRYQIRQQRYINRVETVTSKAPRRAYKHVNWHDVDWSCGTSKLASLMGVKDSTVSRARRKYAPHTLLTNDSNAQT